MAIFSCKLGTAEGKIIEKELEAVDSAVLRQSLEEQGFFVFELKKKPLQFLWEKGIARKRVDNKELLTFNQELLVLLKAGLPIIQALDTILERLTKGKLAELLVDIREDIKGGAALSEAFAKYPRAFSHLYVASIRAGERTGDLPQTIRRYISFLKRVEGFRKKVLSALFYPAILVTLSFIVVFILLIYVIPKFSQIFLDMGSQLPLPTQILISVTSGMRSYLPLVLAGFAGAGFMFRRWRATAAGRYSVDSAIIRTPFIGDLVTKYAVAGFTKTFATVIGSGTPIVDALKMSVGTLNNVILERKLLDAVARVEEGTSLAIAFENVKLMPPLAIRMLGVGETTGSLEEMLEEISEYFEEEIDRKLNVLTTAIEPAILVFTGLIIGTIIITMYLPIFKIAGAVSS